MFLVLIVSDSLSSLVPNFEVIMVDFASNDLILHSILTWFVADCMDK